MHPYTRVVDQDILLSRRRILATYLRDRRQEMGVTQSQIADRLDVPQSWVSTVEAGRRKLEFGELLLIFQALELDPHAEINRLMKQVSE